jgi:hypothetical protein
MQITLKQTELERAVIDYIGKMGISREVGEVAFSATRGAEGIMTTVEVGDLPAAAVAAPALALTSVDTPKATEEVVPDSETADSVEVDIPEGKSLFG